MPASWVTADEVYGNDGKLRRWLEERRMPYVLAVSRSHSLWSSSVDKEGVPVQRRAEEIVAEAPAEAWQRIEVGEGSKGPRASTSGLGAVSGVLDTRRRFYAQWLLVRRSVGEEDDPEQKLAYYRAYGPEQTSLAELARVAGTRWSIEECFERAKGETGLDHYEVRRWEAWHRHITLGQLAHAFLEVPRASANAAEEKGGRPERR